MERSYRVFDIELSRMDGLPEMDADVVFMHEGERRGGVSNPTFALARVSSSIAIDGAPS